MNKRLALAALCAAALLLCSCGTSAADQALLDKVSRTNFYDRGKGTPAEWATDGLGKTEINVARRILAGKLGGDKKDARAKLSKLWAEGEQGFQWPIKVPPTVEIPYGRAGAIDGVADEPAWRQALVFKGQYPLGSLTRRSESNPAWRLLWDEEYLYISADLEDRTLSNRPYDEVKKLWPWDADCFEVFLMTEPGVKCYWEVVVNPSNQLFDGLHLNNRWGGFLGGPEADLQGLRRAVRVYPGGTGYCVELAVPWREMPGYIRGNTPKPGEEIRFMLVNIDDGKRHAPVPFLYDGHNIFGYLRGTLVRR